MRACVCLGLLLGMLLSWRLWLSSGRHFPVLPCFGLGALPAPFDWGLFLAALGLCGAAIARPWDRWAARALVAVMVLLGILDQMRWQPWVYQYLLCLVPLAFVWKRDDRAGMEAALDVVRLIVIAIYIWSGIHKFGVQFQGTYQAHVVGQLLGATSGFLRDSISWSGKLVPWIEISIGVMLVFPRVRKLGVFFSLGMHAFILLMLGPFGTGTNSVIWPWNLTMAGLVVALFWGFEGWALGRLFAVRRLLAPAAGIGILVLLMPVWSYSKKWDQYLSFHLYSGHHQRMALLVRNEKAAGMDEFYRRILRPADTAPGQLPTHQELGFANWAMAELNVPMPSEDRMLLRVAKALAGRLDLSAEDYFYRDYPELLAQRGFDRYSPVEVKGMSRFPDFRYGKPEE